MSEHEFRVGDRVLVPGVVEHVGEDGRKLVRFTSGLGARIVRADDDLRSDTGGRDLTERDVHSAIRSAAGGAEVFAQDVADYLNRIARGDQR